MENGITRANSVFVYWREAGLKQRPVRYGPEFTKPDKAVLRRHRTEQHPKMFEADELSALIDGEHGPEQVKRDPILPLFEWPGAAIGDPGRRGVFGRGLGRGRLAENHSPTGRRKRLLTGTRA